MQGTGHTTWDGAVLLAKYLEHDSGRGRMKGKRVLETGAGAWFVCWGVVVGGGNFGTLCRPGCLVLPYRFGPRQRFPSTPIHVYTHGHTGTGLVGLACAALGAKEVLLTDLPYTLGNLEANARRNEVRGVGCGGVVVGG